MPPKYKYETLNEIEYQTLFPSQKKLPKQFSQWFIQHWIHFCGIFALFLVGLFWMLSPNYANENIKLKQENDELKQKNQEFKQKNREFEELKGKERYQKEEELQQKTREIQALRQENQELKQNIQELNQGNQEFQTKKQEPSQGGSNPISISTTPQISNSKSKNFLQQYPLDFYYVNKQNGYKIVLEFHKKAPLPKEVVFICKLSNANRESKQYFIRETIDISKYCWELENVPSGGMPTLSVKFLFPEEFSMDKIKEWPDKPTPDATSKIAPLKE